MLTITVKNGKTTTKTRGSVAEIDKDLAAAYQFIVRHAEYTDGVNHRILNGHWADRMDDDGVIELTEDGE